MIAEMPSFAAEAEAPVEELVTETSAATEYPVQSDPTIANAGLTELNAPEVSAMTNGHAPAFEAQGITANAAAEANWDPSTEMSGSQEWVEVPRDAAETDNGVTATPAAPSNVQSWADDQPDSPGEVI
jgi:hypothetical protein